MEKFKLKQTRVRKGFTQQQMADALPTVISNYCRKESGTTKISIPQWEKLAKILEVSLEEIYEADENQIIICNDNATGVNYQGTTNIHPVPEFLLTTQQKYIERLEAENAELKALLAKK